MKRPSFQFYVKDFISDRNVQAMTNEEIGVYIKLLCFMWEDESCELPDDKDYLARICHCDKSVITNLYHTFKLVNSKLQHKRLNIERNRQDIHRQKQSEGGQKGMASRWKRAQNKQKNKLVITRDNFASASASASSIKSPTVIAPDGVVTKNEIKKTEYGNPEINKMIVALRQAIGIEAFVDRSIERNIGKHLVGLIGKIGAPEFRRRLDIILSDSFHKKNCNKIKYIYNQILAFVEPASRGAIIS